MSNERLRHAIRNSGLTNAQLAEQLRVDQKTVERWLTPGRLPHPRNRQQLARILDIAESELWGAPPVRPGPSADSDVEDPVRQIALLESERRQYELALLRIAEHSAAHTRVTSREVRYEIGATPEEDIATDTWQIEAVDSSRGVLWWLIAIGASGEKVPQKSTARQFDQLEAQEILDDGGTRSVPVLHLDHRNGKTWAIAIFDRELPRRQLRVYWAWFGVWNMLRATGRDRTMLDLRELLHVNLESVSVVFRFPETALAPEVRAGAGTPPLVPEVSRDERGCVTCTFRLDFPARQPYTWDMEVRGFGSRQPSSRGTRGRPE